MGKTRARTEEGMVTNVEIVIPTLWAQN